GRTAARRLHGAEQGKRLRVVAAGPGHQIAELVSCRRVPRRHDLLASPHYSRPPSRKGQMSARCKEHGATATQSGSRTPSRSGRAAPRGRPPNGERADADIVRDGAKAAIVEGEFRIAGDLRRAVTEQLEAWGVEFDGETVIVRREVQAGGKSRAIVNQSAVTLGALKR